MKTRLQILIIDDNPVEAALLSGLLRKLTWWEVVPATCSTAESGVARATASHPDLIFVDYMLGAETGTDVIRQLKRAGCRAGFILFTGLHAEQAIVEALRSGADDYLSKSELTLDNLGRSIHHTLERVATAQKLRETLDSLTHARDELEQRVQERTQELSEAHDQLNIITTAAHDAIVMLDPHSHIIFWNPAAERIFGFTTKEVTGMPISRLLDPESTFNELARHSMDVNTGETHHKPPPNMVVESLAVRKDGEQFYVEGSFSAVHIRGAWYAVGILRDITQRKAQDESLRRAKEEAEAATRLKDKFVSLVVHDLRGPFTTILGFLELLENDHKSPLSKRQRAFLSWIRESSKKMLQMIDELLNISRLKMGKIVPAMRFIDARLTVAKVLDGLEPPAARKNIELLNNIPDGTRLYADPALLTQVLHNLVSNAIKFSHSSQSVALYVPDGERTTIAVADRGVGIAAERVGKLFRLEEKSSTPGTAGELGTGFGLPLSRDLVAAHQGSLDVVSEVGTGSTFFLRLPEVLPNILIVDDDADQRALLVRHLGRLRVVVHEADRGALAIEMLRGRIFHLVICDIIMPNMTGFTMVKQIRELPQNATVPVILVTADNTIDVRDSAFQSGADDFITKPIDPNELIPRVRRFIG